MNQKQYRIQVLIKKHRFYRKMLYFSTKTRNREAQLTAVRKLRHLNHEIGLQTTRSVEISTNPFNINSLSDAECYRQFRFNTIDFEKVCTLFTWNGKTSRNGYKCTTTTAACIVLRRLSYPCRWRDLEITFGMHESALSEVFHECLHTFVNNYQHLVRTFRTELT